MIAPGPVQVLDGGVLAPQRTAERLGGVRISRPIADVRVDRLAFVAPVSARRILRFPVVSAGPQPDAQQRLARAVMPAELRQEALHVAILRAREDGLDVIAQAVLQ